MRTVNCSGVERWCTWYTKWLFSPDRVLRVVTAKTQYSLRNAESYFAEHLCVGDYYEEGQQVAGEWFGQAANRLGLSERVLADDFRALCENQNPSTQETLTVRLKTTRTEDGQTTANRRIFYDFTFSPPKSVSLVALLAGDSRIEAAHQRAVRSALGEFEAFAATRIRRGGTRSHRTTGNLAAALFTHDTSRALDPHLHTHCIVFNATFDPFEKRWKALENHELLRSRRFVENAYYHELARDLRRFGYEIRNRARGDFEVEGVTYDLCTRFSKRHAQIDQSLAVMLQKRPELIGSNLKDLRERLAEAERARKQQTLSRPELQTLWDGQITAFEREQLRKLTISPDSNRPRSVITLTEGIRWSEDHLFDRNSVVPECQVWQEALGRMRGEEFSVTELKETTRRRGYIRDAAHPGDVTLRDVLLREWEIIRIAKEGVGEVPALVEASPMNHSELDDEQRKALDRLLRSTNTVTLFRGGAGTGKSFVLRRLVEEVRQSNRAVVVLAPQRQQVVEMEKSGFLSPRTVASFLQRKELPQGALVVVDEAGQIGGRHMLDLLRLARQSNARVLLSGDSRQHGPVEASDALVAIEKHSGLRPVELHSIRRQNPALGRDEVERQQIREYRTAVEAAADGKLADSFAKLDAAGAVISCGLDNQAEKLSEEYLRIQERSASAVVVSQTWAEVHRLNTSIRDALKSKGLLGHSDTVVESLDKLDLTNAQKRDDRFYPPEAIIVFNQKVRNTEPGKPGKLAGIVSSGVLVEVDGLFVTVQNRLLDRITVCLPRQIPLADGDRLHFKANRAMASGSRVTNGELVTVKGVEGDGRIILTDGRILDANFREFQPGYAITSYGSQGKTVDYVLFSDSTIKAATNAQQWYVSISRGRRGIRIFTSDKEQLRENLVRSGHRPLALDLVGGLPRPGGRDVWHRLRGYLLRFGKSAADRFIQIKTIHRRQNPQPPIVHEHKTTRVLGERSKRSRSQNRSVL